LHFPSVFRNFVAEGICVFVLVWREGMKFGQAISRILFVYLTLSCCAQQTSAPKQDASVPTLPTTTRLNPLSYHSLAVQARAKISNSQPRTARITMQIDAKGLQWELPGDGKHRCEVSVVAAGFSSKGGVVAHTLKEFEVNVDDRKYIELVKHGMVMNLVVELPPTAVRMRVVARDSTNGNLGTADLTPEGEQFH
jgi:hypothetical protein